MNPVQQTKSLAALCGMFVLLGGGLSRVHATTVALAESTGTVEIYLAGGTQVSATYVVPSTSLAIGNNMAMRFGTFTGGFTPTISNASSWFNNFVGVNGFLTVGGTSAGRLSASITAGDGQAINAPVSANSGVGADGSKSIVLNAQMYAIIWNSTFVSNTSGGNTFNPTATGLQAVVVTNPGWIMPSSASLDLTAFNYALSSGTVALSGLGSVDLVNKGLTMAVIPEPSTLTLFLLGLSSVFAVRRRCS
ncbi:MAG: PEP-CTERM sorting domain-containing protein [Micrococcales bacterium]|nr:PEP-CTERM sorting domain-containing protein [Micrococcales bacterium]